MSCHCPGHVTTRHNEYHLTTVFALLLVSITEDPNNGTVAGQNPDMVETSTRAMYTDGQNG